MPDEADTRSSSSIACTPYLDAVVACHSPLWQIAELYKQGAVDDCKAKWTQLFDCAALRAKPDAEALFTCSAQYDPAEGIGTHDENQTRPRLTALAMQLVGHVTAHARAEQEWPKTLTVVWGVSCDGEAKPLKAKHSCSFPAVGGGHEDVYTAALVAAAMACLRECEPGAVLLLAQLSASSLQPMQPEAGHREEQRAAAAQLAQQQLAEAQQQLAADECAPLQATALFAALAAAPTSAMGHAVLGAVDRRRQVIAALLPGSDAADGSGPVLDAEP